MFFESEDDDKLLSISELRSGKPFSGIAINFLTIL